MSGIDYIGTKRIALRQTGDRDYPNVSIRRLRDDQDFELNGEEFADLAALVVALMAGDRYLQDGN